MRYILLLLLLASSALQAQFLTPGEAGLKATLSLPCTMVKDQAMSSTCWSFSSVSFLESEMIKGGMEPVDLSEMFIARYSYIRKIKRHLEVKGQNFFTPGGQFHDVAWVLRNYGIVPESVYPGLRGGKERLDHSLLDTVMSHFVNDLVMKGITQLTLYQEQFVDSVLDFYLGTVPASFMYHDKKYSPQSFLKEAVRLNPDDYVEITSYTHHPFYTWFVLEDKYNWTGDSYYNVSVDDFKKITDYALLNGYTVGWDGDADDDDFHYFSATAYLKDAVKDQQKERQEAFASRLTLLDHMMHIVGKTTDPAGTTWYYIKNSWGNSNVAGGFLFMQEDYFLQRTVAIIVNKKAVPAAIREKPGFVNN